jgi:hypothetical protein
MQPLTTKILAPPMGKKREKSASLIALESLELDGRERRLFCSKYNFTFDVWAV